MGAYFVFQSKFNSKTRLSPLPLMYSTQYIRHFLSMCIHMTMFIFINVNIWSILVNVIARPSKLHNRWQHLICTNATHLPPSVDILGKQRCVHLISCLCGMGFNKNPLSLKWRWLRSGFLYYLIIICLYEVMGHKRVFNQSIHHTLRSLIADQGEQTTTQSIRDQDEQLYCTQGIVFSVDI